MSKPNIAIVGVTGAVGMEILHCLDVRDFPYAQLRLLTSGRSSGKKISFQKKEFITETLNENSFNHINLTFFATDNDTAKQFAPMAVKSGSVVIDNSSAFRMDSTVPLVIPEINPHALSRHQGIIANPNCSTILGITPLWPIHQKNKIKRLLMATYQAASGAGSQGMTELLESTRAYLNEQTYPPKVFPYDYAFNLFCHNSKVNLENGYNEEENKIIEETKKIFNDPFIRVSATCVRIPVLRAHSEVLHFECENPIFVDEVRSILQSAPGVKLVDDRERNYFPMPKDASGQEAILVGHIRQDISDPNNHSIVLFLSGDQLLKGAALNAVQIGELLLKD